MMHLVQFVHLINVHVFSHVLNASPVRCQRPSRLPYRWSRRGGFCKLGRVFEATPILALGYRRHLPAQEEGH